MKILACAQKNYYLTLCQHYEGLNHKMAPTQMISRKNNLERIYQIKF